MSGIYIHVPFCKQACTYCDFHFSTSLNDKDPFVSALVEEVHQRHAYLAEKHIESIYLGGGTPSLLSPADLGRIVEALSRHFSWNAQAEITLEANPDDIDVQKLRAWRDLGINRLSIGLQSFSDEELRWMNRAHTAAESLSSVKMAQDAGFSNLTIDLIYGSKFQTQKTWEETLQKAVSLNTQHISAYNLTIEDKTVLGVKHGRGQEPSVNDDLSSMQFSMMRQVLSDAGFIHYEISNFGRDGYFAKHNSNYWLGKHYLGLGPSAHSFNGVSRQWNVRHNKKYIQALAEGKTFYEIEHLTDKDRYNEYVLTRLRTIWGCDVNEMGQLFGEKTVAHFLEGVNALREFFEERKGIYTLNEEGRLRADGIASELFLL